MTDDCGNTKTCNQTITVDDNTMPTITCPDNITVECEDEVPACPASFAAFDALPGASASDNCDDNLTYACTTGPLTGGACGGTITREHKVTDDCGNTKTCNQTITVDDNTLPTITCPDNVTVECEDEVPACPASFAAFDALPGASASDNCDDNLTYACTTGPLTGGACGGTITREHKVTDDCGNTKTCNQTITVDDNTMPTITCPDNVTVECEDEVPACPASFAAFDALPGASASDNCDDNLTYACTTGPLTGGACGGTITREHKVTDDCGNTKTCNQTITVDDNTDPYWTLMPEDQTVECDGAGNLSELVSWLSGFQAADDCGSVMVTNDFKYLNVNSPASIAGLYESAFAIFGPQSYNVTGDLEIANDGVGVTSDACQPLVGFTPGKIALIDRGTCLFTIKVKNAQNAGAIGVVICNNVVGDPVGMAGTDPTITIPVQMIGLDDCNAIKTTATTGTVNVTLFANGLSDDCGATGSAAVLFTATDECGNSIEKSATFTIEDTALPSITCPTNISVECEDEVPACPANLAAFLALPDASASDNCDDNLSYMCSTDLLTGGACGGTLTRTHTVTDDCGNDSSCQQTITVDDNTLPSISCPDNITVECEDEVPACPASFAAFDALPGASASDNCDDNLTYACTTGLLTGGACGGTITREHKVTDDCGNTKTCNQTITVDDNTNPYFSACPTSVINLGCNPTLPNAARAKTDAGPALDNCGTRQNRRWAARSQEPA
ncbi:MAG: hypothetical protein IPH12_01150 [Saprospirales bacterium]|nr:hypothetical protein [Saprospirales bacterium]